MTITKKQIKERIGYFLFVLKHIQYENLYVSIEDNEFSLFNSDSYESDENNIKVEINFNERSLSSYYKKVCEILSNRNFVII